MFASSEESSIAIVTQTSGPIAPQTSSRTRAKCKKAFAIIICAVGDALWHVVVDVDDFSGSIL